MMRCKSYTIKYVQHIFVYIRVNQMLLIKYTDNMIHVLPVIQTNYFKCKSLETLHIPALLASETTDINSHVCVCVCESVRQLPHA